MIFNEQLKSHVPVTTNQIIIYLIYIPLHHYKTTLKSIETCSSHHQSAMTSPWISPAELHGHLGSGTTHRASGPVPGPPKKTSWPRRRGRGGRGIFGRGDFMVTEWRCLYGFLWVIQDVCYILKHIYDNHLWYIYSIISMIYIYIYMYDVFMAVSP